MAFRVPTDGQVRENRKILEQLEEEKKKLRMKQTGAALPGTQGAPATLKSSTSLVEAQHMSPQQRTALQHAHQNSVGYFITQDSSFGNLILPVIPRHEKPP